MLPSKQFDPRKFIDREAEKARFEALLTFRDDARILAIRDQSGMGKSHLLEFFHHSCAWKDIPVSLIDLKQLSDQSPLMFAKTVVKDLNDLGISFPSFNHYDNARISADFNTILSSVYLQGANFTGASNTRISATMANVDHAESVYITTSYTELTIEQKEKAEDVCVRSFLNDLCTLSNTQPIVLLVDSFEYCCDPLRRWLHKPFLRSYFFDQQQRPSQLLLVVAGQNMPDFEVNWSPEDRIKTVALVERLHRWTRNHVEECLQVHGFRYEEKDIDAFHRLVENGLPPALVVQAIETMLAQQRVV